MSEVPHSTMNSFSSLMSSMNPFSSSLSFNIGSSSSSKYTSEGTYSVRSNVTGYLLK
ncbi:hypothetical protein M2142_002470 [Fusobacterium sp. PH5-29]|uniref:hypothetical protein n=1 Tax=Fusobacterium sp. PH5-29 TaxID=1742400 RepID=UPI003D22789B